MDKFKISEYELQGNLKDSKQILITEYLPELIKDDKVYPKKVAIKIIAPSDNGETGRLSFRMEYPEQCKQAAFNVIKTYFYFLKMRGLPLDEGYLPDMFYKESKRIIQEVKRL